MNINIRKAIPSDSEALTEISFKSKRFWNYPDEYFEIWRHELTISKEYIIQNDVFIAEENGIAVGYYSIVENENDFWSGKVFVMKGIWLEHIFILPEYIGKGIGTLLIQHAKVVCKDMDCSKLYIFSDPNSRGFYEKIGARFIKESPSSIEGRTVPVFQLDVEG